MSHKTQRRFDRNGFVWPSVALLCIIGLVGCGGRKPEPKPAVSKPAPEQATDATIPEEIQPAEKVEPPATHRPAEETDSSMASQPAVETEPPLAEQPAAEDAPKEPKVDDADEQAPPEKAQPAIPVQEPEPTTPQSKTDEAKTEEVPDPAEVKEFVEAAWRGDEAKLLEFLDKGMNIEARDGNSHTALDKAAFGRKLGAVKLLLEKGAKVMAPNSFDLTPLHHSPSKEVAELLVAHGADVNACDRDGRVPLHRAVDKDVIEFLAAQGADVNVRDSDGKTPLHWQVGRTEAAMSLLALGAHVDTRDRDGKTPLHAASEGNRHEIIAKILEEGAHTEARNFLGRTPLHTAARRNAKEAATVLIENGAQVNARDHAGHTPLDVAVAEKREDVIQILKDAGGKPSDAVVQTGEGGNIFYWMAASAEQVKERFDQGEKADVRDRNGKTLLHKAAEQGNVPVIELLLAKSLDVNAKDAHGNSPLHEAMLAGKTEAAELLVAKDAKLDAFTAAGLGKVADLKSMITAEPNAICSVDYDANSLLHSAVLGGHKEAVEFLIENGAHLEARNRGYRTPLLLAAHLGQTEIVDLLLTKGANISAAVCMGQDSYMGTALHQAAREGHTTVVSLLLQKGVDVDIQSKYDDTPLHMACRSDTGSPSGDKAKAAELLLERNANVNAVNRNGQTPLIFAAPWNEELVRRLIERGADVNARGQYQRSALHNVNSKKEAETLIANGADVNARDEFDETPLFRMMYQQKREIAELLIEKGADVNAKGNTNGNHNADTPLHHAARGFGTERIVELLLENGANPNVKDKNGQTPLALAEKEKKAKVIELLKKHGAK